MSKTTDELRQLWAAYECAEASMVLVPFGPDKIRVAPPTSQVWDALAAVMLRHGYNIRTQDTDSYNCRAITGGNGRSLHSFGIALDVNWETNPFIDHAGNRPVRFSDKATQDERAKDVRFGLADTDMTPQMISDIEAIKTKDQLQVFEWGGSWKSRKDCMHFELDVSLEELARGLDPATIPISEDVPAASGDTTQTDESSPVSLLPAASAQVQIVIARGGLRLRSGPSETAGILRSIPQGTKVSVLSREGLWALVDLQGDQLADGFVFSSFLRPIPTDSVSPGPEQIAPEAPVGTDSLSACTSEVVAQMFPSTPQANIVANLPFVLAGLRTCSLSDRSMALVALATIRAETEGFVPISEGQSRFNTKTIPFDLYEGRNDLGNDQPGDGPLFKGRGYVQLTGRSNYFRLGSQIGSDLISNPELANDPTIAGLILARFLKNSEDRIREALANRDLAKARKLVNGGSHGLERFTDAFQRGDRVLPT